MRYDGSTFINSEEWKSLGVVRHYEIHSVGMEVHIVSVPSKSHIVSHHSTSS